MTHGLSSTRWRNPDDRFGQWFGVLAALMLGVVPNLVFALEPRPAEFQPRSAMWDVVISLAGSAQIIVPVLYLIWVSGRSWRFFGIVEFDLRVDLLLSLGYVALGWVGYFIIEWAMLWAGELIPGLDAAIDVVAPMHGHWASSGSVALAHFFLWMLVGAASEELVTKSYLVPRVRELTGRAWIAVVVSAGAFASYHIYQGSRATIMIFIEQLVFAWLFARIGRVWPFIIGHAALNLVIEMSSRG